MIPRCLNIICKDVQSTRQAIKLSTWSAHPECISRPNLIRLGKCQYSTKLLFLHQIGLSFLQTGEDGHKYKAVKAVKSFTFWGHNTFKGNTATRGKLSNALKITRPTCIHVLPTIFPLTTHNLKQTRTKTMRWVDCRDDDVWDRKYSVNGFLHYSRQRSTRLDIGASLPHLAAMYGNLSVTDIT